MPARDLFLGDWELIPELSLYQTGDPPASGRYEIRDADGEIRFDLRWTGEADGQEHALSFGGSPDGRRQPIPRPEGAPPGTPDGLTITRVDARTLDSQALVGEAVVAYARRVVSRDGALMAVLQEARPPEGAPLRNTQVYRRVGPVPDA